MKPANSRGLLPAILAFIALVILVWVNSYPDAQDSPEIVEEAGGDVSRKGNAEKGPEGVITLSDSAPGNSPGGRGKPLVRIEQGATLFETVDATDWELNGSAKGFSYRSGRIFIQNPKPIRVVFPQLEAARDRQVDRIALAFAPGEEAVAKVTHVVRRSDQSYTLQGQLEGDDGSEFSISVHHEAVVGNFQGQDIGLRELRYVGGGFHKIQEIVDELAPRCQEVPVSQGLVLPPVTGPRGLADGVDKMHGEGQKVSEEFPLSIPTGDDPVLDVMVAFSTNAKNEQGGINAILALINQGVDDTNLAFSGSGVAAELRLVHTTEVAYSDTGALTALDAVTGETDGEMDHLHVLRNTFGADFVSLWTPLSDACGIGWLMNSLSSSFESYAFNVTDPYCQYKYTFTHELGHNFGCSHAVGDTGPRGDGLYDWSHGSRWYGSDSTYYRSVMAYNPGARTRQYSNPDVYFAGGQTGTEGSEDNAGSIGAALPILSEFRPDSGDDHGDDLETATAVRLNGTIGGNLEEAGDLDVFEFQVTGGAITISASSSGSTDTVGRLLNSSGGLIVADDNGGSGANFRIERTLPVGTYYVEVGGKGGSTTGDYLFSLSISGDDHGGDISTATPMGVPGTRAGELEVGGDEDFFRLVLSKAGTLTVRSSGATDTYGYLLNSAGSILISDDDSGSNTNFQFTQDLPPGIYYVRLRGYSVSTIGHYSLVVGFQVIPDDHANEFEEATNVVLGLAPGSSSVEGEFEVPGDIDFFRVEVPGSLSGLDSGDGVLDMEGPPTQGAGVLSEIPSYSENGFVIKAPGVIPSSPPYDLVRIGSGGGWPGRPANGGAYLQTGQGDKLEVVHGTGEPFDVASIDVAEYGTNPPTKLIQFTGYRYDGSTLVHTVRTDGVMDGGGSGDDFETILFPPSFGGLVKLEISSGPFAIDNLRINLWREPLGSPTGVLSFQTSGGTDTFGTWYSSGLGILSTANSGGSGTNFRMEREVTAGDRYFIEVVENGNDQYGLYSLINSYTPPASNLPIAPSSVTASSNSGLAVNVSWSSAPKAVRYVVYRGTSADSANASVLAASVDGNSFSDTWATPGVSYFYWVKSLNANGESAGFGGSDSGLRLATPPRITGQPSSGSVVWEGSIALSVNAESDSGNLSYQWYQGVSGDTSQPMGADSPTLSLSNVQSNGRFWVRVANAHDDVDSVAALVTVVPTGAPNVTASNNLFTDRIRLSWESVPTAVSFRVYRGTTSNFAQASLLTTTGGTSFADTSANPGTNYFYFVTAVDSDGDEGSPDLSSSLSNGRRATSGLDGALIPIRDARDLVFDSASANLYIATGSGFVEEYDVANQEIDRSFRPGTRLRGLDVSTDQTVVFVAEELSDGSGNGLVHRITVSGGATQSHSFALAAGEGGVHDLACLENGEILVSPVRSGAGAKWLRELNGSNGTFAVRSDAPGGGALSGDSMLPRNGNRSLLAVVDSGNSSGPWYQFSDSTGQFGPVRSSGATHHQGAVDREGQLFSFATAAGAIISDPAGSQVWNYSGNASGMIFSPVLNEWYVIDHALDRIRIYDTRIWALLDEIPIGSNLQANSGFGDGTLTSSDDGQHLALITPEGVRLYDISSRIPSAIPSVPGAFSASNSRTTDVMLSWTEDSQAAEYRIFRAESDDFTQASLLEGIVLGTSYSDSSAIPGQDYYYWVEAGNVLGSSAPSGSAIGLRPIDAPTQVRASDEQYEDRVQLNWAHSQSGALFEIYRSSDDQLGNAAKVHETSGFAWSDTSQVPGAPAYYWVRAVFQSVPGPFGTPDSGLRRLARPTGLEADTVNDGIALSWDAIPGVSYRVFRGVYDSPGLASEIGLGDDSGVWLDTTAQFRQYYYFIQAVVGGNDSILSESAAAIRVLGTPGEFTGSTDRLDDVTLNWNPLPGATLYRIYRSATPNRGNASLAVSTGELSFIDEGVNPGETWYYWIQGFGPGVGLGTESEMIAATRFGGAMNEVSTPGSSAGAPSTSSEIADPSTRAVFNGLLRAEGDPETVVGNLNARLFRSLLTLTLQFEGTRFVGRGITLETDGTAEWSFTDGDGQDMVLALAQTRSDENGGLRLEGTLSVEGAIVARLNSGASTHHPRWNAFSGVGKYTLLLPHDRSDDPALVPAGEGIGYGAINPAGNARFLIILADGQRVSVAGTVDDDGRLPIFAAPYRRWGGQLAGTFQMREMENISHLDGQLQWNRPADVPSPPLYSSGFDTDLPVVGAVYQPPVGGTRVLSQLADDTANTMWSFEGGGVNPAPSNRWMTWDERNRITDLGNTSQGKVNLRIVAGTGLVSGQFKSADGANFPFTGVAMPIQGLVAGYFVGVGQSGRFTLEPAMLPELTVRDGSGNVLSQGDTIDFGGIGTDGGLGERLFELENTGEGRLWIATNPQITEGADSFSLVAARAGELAPGEVSRIRIRFSPGSEGVSSGRILIATNDRSSHPFELNLSGTGIASSSDSDVEQGLPMSSVLSSVGEGLPDGATRNFDEAVDPGNFSGWVFTPKGAPLGFGTGLLRSDRRQPGTGLVSLRLEMNGLKGAVVGRILADGSLELIRENGALAREFGVFAGAIVESADGQIFLSGELRNRNSGVVAARFQLTRAAFNGRGDVLPPVAHVGTTTLALPAPENLGTGYPSGDGIGVLTVRTNGSWNARLLLSDQQRATLSGRLNGDGSLEFFREWRFGCLAGRWEFRDDLGASVGNLAGSAIWERPVFERGPVYPAGFRMEVSAVGNHYVPPARGERILTQLVNNDANATAFWVGDALKRAIPDGAVNWDGRNVIVLTSPTEGEVFSARVSPRDGWLRGTYRERFFDSSTGRFANRVVKVQAISLQAQGLATGSWTEGSADGGFGIEPAVSP